MAAITARLRSIVASPLLPRLGLPLLLLVCFLRYLPGLFAGAGRYHDDGLYMLTGRALAEGHGYRIASLSGMPPQTKYPVFYPALLALLWKLDPDFPANTFLFRFANVVLGLVTLALTYRLLVRFRYATPPMALLVVLFWGLSAEAATFTSQAYSEMLATLFLMASLWGCAAAGEKETDKEAVRPALASGVLLGLAFLTRSSVFFLGFAFAWALWKRGRTRVLALALGVLPAYLGWMLWSRQAASLPGWDVRGYYLDYLGWTLHQYALIPLPRVLAANLVQLSVFALPSQVV